MTPRKIHPSWREYLQLREIILLKNIGSKKLPVGSRSDVQDSSSTVDALGALGKASLCTYRPIGVLMQSDLGRP